MDEHLHQGIIGQIAYEQILYANQNAKLLTEGRVILDLHPECQIQLFHQLHLGYHLRTGSQTETYLKMQKNAQLIVNGYFKAFYGASIELFPDAVLTVGNSYINSECIIACAKQITIGDGVNIARRVMIYDSDHHRILNPAGETLNPAKPVVIKNHVWIGVGAIILKGVTLGEGCIVAAGAVVTKDVPAGCLAAGNPAKVIRQNIEWR